MAVIDARSWMDHLPERECWELLAQARVGRLGVLVDSGPEIYPVNFVVDREALVFRTGPGTKLRGLDRSPAVCLEVDEISATERTGWSVLVKGAAHEITDVEEERRAASLDLDLWVVGDRARWVRIQPREVTGRRLRPR